MLRPTLEVLGTSGRRVYAALAVLSVVSSLLQTAGVALISAFFSTALGGKLPAALNSVFGTNDQLTTLGILVLALALSGSALSALTTYLGLKFTWTQYERTAGLLMERSVARPYVWHLQRNSASLIALILSETRFFCTLLQSQVLILVKGSEMACITALLLWANPKVAILAFGVFLLTYALLYHFNRGFVARQGELQVRENREQQKMVAEAFTGIKAIKVAGNGSFFQARFRASAARAEKATVKIQFAALLPKYLIETLLIGGLVSFIVVAKARHWPAFDSIPLLALYGVAALRMLPAAQQIYYSLTTLTSGWATVNAVHAALFDRSPPPLASERNVSSNGALVSFQKVTYSYPESDRPSLSQVSFEIREGEKIGLVGPTGAGKTTLVDLLLGLLTPSEGRISFSQEALSHNQVVAYVPQQLHFLDDTIAGNIAWGIPPEQRDLERVRLAARQACIHDFVESLANGYDTPMGEQANRLSGGQRQRIGIARALYRNPALLVLDEASNALDAETEQQVLASLLAQDLTLVVIAHRLSAVRACDRIFVMRQGCLIATGPFDQLMDSCPPFRAMVEADNHADVATPDTGLA